MHQKIGIVIPVRNCLEYTLKAVSSIQTAHPYQIIVVDDHSEPPTKTWLTSRPDIITISDPSESTGLAFNWNLGIRAAQKVGCSLFLVINNDIVFHPDAIDNMVERINRGDVIMVTGYHIGQTGASLEDLPTYCREEEIESTHPDFCCFMITEHTLTIAGWFDENYLGAYYEDCDYHATLLSRGEGAISISHAPIYHFGSRTLAENASIAPRISQSAVRNCAYFIRKWNGHPFVILRDLDQFREKCRRKAEDFEGESILYNLEKVLVNTLFCYEARGDESRQMTFLPNHFVGQGATQQELYWNVRHDHEEWFLDISQYSGITCSLKYEGGRIWQGRNESNEQDVKLTALPIKLDVGSGGAAADTLGIGWLGVDAFTPEADIQATMWNLPYEDGTVEEIFSSHALEHVGKAYVPLTLREWHRVLKSGGKLTLRVPDLEWCCRHWLQNQTIGWDLDVLFGHQSHEGEYHKTGFSETILRKYVQHAFFHVTYFERLSTHNQMTLSIECIKPSLLEDLYLRCCQIPSDINEHLPMLSKLASDCTHITEFCERTYESTVAFLHAAPHVLCAYNTSGRVLEPELEAVESEVSTRMHFRVSSSLAIDIEPTDLLFLDNIHTYHHVRQELERHSARVSKYIVLHDTTTYGDRGDRDGEVGIWHAIREFITVHPEWTLKVRLENNNGLTILERRTLKK